ncbi:MAG: 4-alpha-glucanotransferase [Peptococcaceae bacterium BICA1-8]|nr:MAG: 4-alpha-glucanotransferase [Peptococcaceae bacterium BICA1-8]
MKLIKGAGVLLHPTSLPGNYGIGDLGQEAYKFVDFLNNSGQKYWQVLPFNPPGFGESPYQAFSAFAGNPLLISPDKLIQDGLLEIKDIESIPQYSESIVEFEKARVYKDELLRTAFKKFEADKCNTYLNFEKDNILWLENYSLFMALKNYFGGSSWNQWDKLVAKRDEAALNRYRALLQDEIQYQKFLQFKFFSQWLELKEYTNLKGIKIIGDIPIFVALDSSDVWANPHLFCLDEAQNPLNVAGVPPDYFSKTGQLWGNPHYDWARMEQDGYKWWRQRFITIFSLVDFVRLDHFRGFEAYWEIPFGEETAINGKWVKGPGESFFSALEKNFGEMPIIAEDLGIITSEVEQLKNKFGFPGMKILQFILEDTTQELVLPLNFEYNSVVYTGTHDNDTILGWFKKHSLEKNIVQKMLADNLGIYPNMNADEACWRFIDLALQSNSVIAIIPLQDILCLDSSARMNYPGTLGNNWNWRFKKGVLTKEIETRLEQLVQAYNR